MTELYKKYRPKRLADVLGNDAHMASLKTMLKEGLPHAILLTGPSGVGKTTVARILKTKLQCSDFDFEEINAADFRGIDTVRDIRSSMCLSPVSGECRIYLVDECGKLSTDAQNAFLKLLEDTPSHVYFFLATTEPEKLLRTVRTRCTEVAMKPLQGKDMLRLLDSVIKGENKSLSNETKQIVIDQADGSARMALVLLEQVLSLPEENVLESITAFKSASSQAIDLCRVLLDDRKGWTPVADVLNTIEVEPESIRRLVLGYMQSVLLKPKGSRSNRASSIIDLFEEPFWNGGKAALVNACYRLYRE